MRRSILHDQFASQLPQRPQYTLKPGNNIIDKLITSTFGLDNTSQINLLYHNDSSLSHQPGLNDENNENAFNVRGLPSHDKATPFSSPSKTPSTNPSNSTPTTIKPFSKRQSGSGSSACKDLSESQQTTSRDGHNGHSAQFASSRSLPLLQPPESPTLLPHHHSSHHSSPRSGHPSHQSGINLVPTTHRTLLPSSHENIRLKIFVEEVEHEAEAMNQGHSDELTISDPSPPSPRLHQALDPTILTSLPQSHALRTDGNGRKKIVRYRFTAYKISTPSPTPPLPSSTLSSFQPPSSNVPSSLNHDTNNNLPTNHQNFLSPLPPTVNVSRRKRKQFLFLPMESPPTTSIPPALPSSTTPNNTRMTSHRRSLSSPDFPPNVDSPTLDPANTPILPTTPTLLTSAPPSPLHQPAYNTTSVRSPIRASVKYTVRVPPPSLSTSSNKSHKQLHHSLTPNIQSSLDRPRSHHKQGERYTTTKERKRYRFYPKSPSTPATNLPPAQSGKYTHQTPLVLPQSSTLSAHNRHRLHNAHHFLNVHHHTTPIKHLADGSTSFGPTSTIPNKPQTSDVIETTSPTHHLDASTKTTAPITAPPVRRPPQFRLSSKVSHHLPYVSPVKSSSSKQITLQNKICRSFYPAAARTFPSTLSHIPGFNAPPCSPMDTLHINPLTNQPILSTNQFAQALPTINEYTNKSNKPTRFRFCSKDNQQSNTNAVVKSVTAVSTATTAAAHRTPNKPDLSRPFYNPFDTTIPSTSHRNQYSHIQLIKRRHWLMLSERNKALLKSCQISFDMQRCEYISLLDGSLIEFSIEGITSDDVMNQFAQDRKEEQQLQQQQEQEQQSQGAASATTLSPTSPPDLTYDDREEMIPVSKIITRTSIIPHHNIMIHNNRASINLSHCDQTVSDPLHSSAVDTTVQLPNSNSTSVPHTTTVDNHDHTAHQFDGIVLESSEDVDLFYQYLESTHPLKASRTSLNPPPTYYTPRKSTSISATAPSTDNHLEATIDDEEQPTYLRASRQRHSKHSRDSFCFEETENELDNFRFLYSTVHITPTLAQQQHQHEYPSSPTLDQSGEFAQESPVDQYESDVDDYDDDMLSMGDTIATPSEPQCVLSIQPSRSHSTHSQDYKSSTPSFHPSKNTFARAETVENDPEADPTFHFHSPLDSHSHSEASTQSSHHPTSTHDHNTQHSSERSQGLPLDLDQWDQDYFNTCSHDGDDHEQDINADSYYDAWDVADQRCQDEWKSHCSEDEDLVVQSLITHPKSVIPKSFLSGLYPSIDSSESLQQQESSKQEVDTASALDGDNTGIQSNLSTPASPTSPTSPRTAVYLHTASPFTHQQQHDGDAGTNLTTHSTLPTLPTYPKTLPTQRVEPEELYKHLLQHITASHCAEIAAFEGRTGWESHHDNQTNHTDADIIKRNDHDHDGHGERWNVGQIDDQTDFEINTGSSMTLLAIAEIDWLNDGHGALSSPFPFGSTVNNDKTFQHDSTLTDEGDATRLLTHKPSHTDLSFEVLLTSQSRTATATAPPTSPTSAPLHQGDLCVPSTVIDLEEHYLSTATVTTCSTDATATASAQAQDKSHHSIADVRSDCQHEFSNTHNITTSQQPHHASKIDPMTTNSDDLVVIHEEVETLINRYTSTTRKSKRSNHLHVAQQDHEINTNTDKTTAPKDNQADDFVQYTASERTDRAKPSAWIRKTDLNTNGCGDQSRTSKNCAIEPQLTSLDDVLTLSPLPFDSDHFELDDDSDVSIEFLNLDDYLGPAKNTSSFAETNNDLPSNHNLNMVQTSPKSTPHTNSPLRVSFVATPLISRRCHFTPTTCTQTPVPSLPISSDCRFSETDSAHIYINVNQELPQHRIPVDLSTSSHHSSQLLFHFHHSTPVTVSATLCDESATTIDTGVYSNPALQLVTPIKSLHASTRSHLFQTPTSFDPLDQQETCEHAATARNNRRSTIFWSPVHSHATSVSPPSHASFIAPEIDNNNNMAAAQDAQEAKLSAIHRRQCPQPLPQTPIWLKDNTVDADLSNDRLLQRRTINLIHRVEHFQTRPPLPDTHQQNQQARMDEMISAINLFFDDEPVETLQESRHPATPSRPRHTTTGSASPSPLWLNTTPAKPSPGQVNRGHRNMLRKSIATFQDRLGASLDEQRDQSETFITSCIKRLSYAMMLNLLKYQLQQHWRYHQLNSSRQSPPCESE